MAIIEITLQYGIAGLAIYFMYNLVNKATKNMAKICEDRLDEIVRRIERLVDRVEEVCKRS